MQPELAAPPWQLTNTPPLWPLEFFGVALNASMSQLLDDCDAGIFGHVWDIASPGTKRRELRVFFQDGLAVLQRRPLPKISYEDCVDVFLPRSRGARGTELQKWWWCGEGLIHDLATAGLLVTERDGRAVSGIHSSKVFSRASIVAFLSNRALVRDPQFN